MLYADYKKIYITQHKKYKNIIFHMFGHIYQFIFYPILIIYNIIISYIITIIQKKNYFSDNYFHIFNVYLINLLFGYNILDIIKFYGIPFISHLIGHHFFESDNIKQPFKYQYKHVLFGYFRTFEFITGKI